MAKPEHVKKAHGKMQDRGWVKKGIWFTPMAAMDLERECLRRGMKPGELLEDLLAKTRPR